MTGEGIDYENPIFRKIDGSTRILALWDQEQRVRQTAETEEEGQTPVRFDAAGRENGRVRENGEPVTYVSGYGTVYTDEDINRALKSASPQEIVPSRDEIGHGTFITSIAAGGIDERNNFEGMAPDCDIAVVKLKQAKQNLRDFYGINPNAACYQEDDILSGIRFLLDVSDQAGKPMVILIGVGTSQGDHGGNSYLEQYIDRLGNFIWLAVVDAAGNELTHGGHYMSRNPDNLSGVIQNSAETGSRYAAREGNPEIVEIAVGRDENDFTLEIWGQAPGILAVGIESPTGQIYDDRTTSAVDLIEGAEVRFLYEGTRVIVEDILMEESTGDQVVVMRFRAPAEGIWKLRIFQDPEIVNPYHIWLPIREFLSADTRFLSPEPDMTLCSPANSNLSITAGGYNHKDNSMYAQSSRGYTRTGRVKPDVAAPSVNVFGAWKNNIYMNMTGTSVGAAHLAGAVALILDWAVTKGNYSQINTRIMKQMIIRGAKREPGIKYPNRITGWGLLDVGGIFDALRT